MAKITIAGAEYEITLPYAEGQVLKANEAAALNGVRGENIRNNVASKITRNKEENAKDSKVPLLDSAAIQALVNEYDKSYEFGSRTAGGVRTPKDPVQAEAQRLAKDAVTAKIKEANKDLKTYPKEKFDSLVTATAASDKIQALAKKLVSQRQGALSVEGLEV